MKKKTYNQRLIEPELTNQQLLKELKKRKKALDKDNQNSEKK